MTLEVSGDVFRHRLIPQGLGLDEAGERTVAVTAALVHAVHGSQIVGVAGQAQVTVQRQRLSGIFRQGLGRAGPEHGARHLLLKIQADEGDLPAAGEGDDVPVVPVILAPDLEIA